MILYNHQHGGLRCNANDIAPKLITRIAPFFQNPNHEYPVIDLILTQQILLTIMMADQYLFKTSVFRSKAAV